MKKGDVKLSSLSITRSKLSSINVVAGTRGSVDLVTTGAVDLESGDLRQQQQNSDSPWNTLENANSPRSNYKMRNELAEIINDHTRRLEQSLNKKEKRTDMLYTKFLVR